MSSVIEINSSDDETVYCDPAPASEDDEVIILSGEGSQTIKTKRPTDQNITSNVDLTNDAALNDFVEDILKTYKDTKFTQHFLQFVKLSFDLESSDGMKRILIKNLVPAYTKADPDYISSNRFKIFVLNSIYKMNTSPDYKFSHLKDLCDVLKSKSVVKRATLITQCKTVSSFKRNKQPNQNMQSKKQKLDIIDLDEEVINVDTVEDVNHNEEKENSNMPHTIYEQNSVTHTQNIVTYEHNSVSYEQNTYLRNQLEKSNGYDKPLDRKIHDLEELIKTRKRMIEKLEQQEVDWDDECSSYIRVDGLKLELVLLYKQLCKLRGENYTHKTKQIRLYPADGRHPGPSQKLESWLNSHTEENGMPTFPDLFDVVKCVEEACKEYGLNWEKTEVLHEARLLFTQCGKALQRRRQKREWKELLRAASDDPAEHDPELQARLEFNRKVARAREEALLKHYSTMDDEIRIKRHKNQRRNSNNTTSLEPHTETNLPNVLKYPRDMKTYHSNLQNRKDMPLFSTSAMTEIGDVNSQLDPNEIPSTSNAGNSLQRAIVSYINDTNKTNNIIADNEKPKDLNTSKNQEQFQQVVAVNVLNYATLRDLGLNNFVESQMDNENNTNIELDRIGNIISEDQDPVETVPVVKQESTGSTNTASENMDNDMVIEQDIPIENGYDGSYVVKTECQDVKLEPKAEYAIEEEDTEYLPEIDSCEGNDTTSNHSYQNNTTEDANKHNKIVEDENLKNHDQDENIIPNDSLLNNSDGKVKINTENIKEEEDETLKLMLEFDDQFSDEVITTVFDIEEPVVFIEISSSEDESESEDVEEEEDLIQFNEEPL